MGFKRENRVKTLPKKQIPSSAPSRRSSEKSAVDEQKKLHRRIQESTKAWDTLKRHR